MRNEDPEFIRGEYHPARHGSMVLDSKDTPIKSNLSQSLKNFPDNTSSNTITIYAGNISLRENVPEFHISLVFKRIRVRLQVHRRDVVEGIGHGARSNDFRPLE
jgi:hypothetical protein